MSEVRVHPGHLHQVAPLTGDLPDWVRLQLDLRKWMSGWVDDLIMNHANTPWRHGHDEGLFARTLPAFYLLSGHQPALQFSEKLARDFISSPLSEACDCFLTAQDAAAFGDRRLVQKWHGYQEEWSCLCHGPENYAWFLAHVAHVSQDSRFTQALLDYAEHIGNFSDSAPAWYDWEARRFRSCHLGTKTVRACAPYDYDSDTHIRVMTVALNAFSLTGDRRYLELVTNWLEKWAEVVMEARDGIPTRLFPVPESEVAGLYGEFGVAGRVKAQYELGQMFLDVVRAGGPEELLRPVRKMISAALSDNDWAMGRLVAKYRILSGDHTFDKAVVDYGRQALERDSEHPALLITVKAPADSAFEGNDYVTIGSGSSVRPDTRSVSMLACAFQITGDLRFAESAMRLAWMRFWASWYLWDGRQFGCRGSWTGRNGVAMHNVIPALLMTASGGFGMLEGETPWLDVVYRREDGAPGLPEGVAALYDVPGQRILLANTTSRPQRITLSSGRFSSAPGRNAPASQTAVELPADSLVTSSAPEAACLSAPENKMC